MPENIAIGFVNLDEVTMRAIAFGLMLFGAFIYSIFGRSYAEIGRGAYFFYTFLIVLGVTLSQVIWLYSANAQAGGYLWISMFISFGAFIAGGFVLGWIALARSRAAFGNNRMAALAFIPFINLLLFVKPSRNPSSIHRVRSIEGWGGVVGGIFAAFAAQWIGTSIEQKAATSQEATVGYVLESQGVAKALKMMASQTRLPLSVDEITTLVLIEANDAQLRRTYVTKGDVAELTDGFRSFVKTTVCSHSPFQQLMLKGVVFAERYERDDNSELGTVYVSAADCN